MVLAISAVTTVIAITAITAWAAVAITAGTVTVTTGSTFAARSALRLYPTLGLGKKGTHRQTEFAGLLVDLDELDFNLVAFLET